MEDRNNHHNHQQQHHGCGASSSRRRKSRQAWNRNTGCPFHCFSLVVCRDPTTNLWLAVEETHERGWWLPGGFVECGDDFFTTALKETREEAGINVTLKGILRLEVTMTTSGARQRVIFYAEPTPGISQKPKEIPDKESLRAAWLSLEELEIKSILPPPVGLRGEELLNWANYIEGGGQIYPLDILSKEETPIPNPRGRNNNKGDDDDDDDDDDDAEKLPTPKSNNINNVTRDDTKKMLPTQQSKSNNNNNHHQSENNGTTTRIVPRRTTQRASSSVPPPPTAQAAEVNKRAPFGHRSSSKTTPVEKPPPSSRPSFSIPPFRSSFSTGMPPPSVMHKKKW